MVYQTINSLYNKLKIKYIGKEKLKKYKKEDNLYTTLNQLIEHYKTNSKIKIDIDFNPIHI